MDELSRHDTKREISADNTVVIWNVGASNRTRTGDLRGHYSRCTAIRALDAYVILRSLFVRDRGAFERTLKGLTVNDSTSRGNVLTFSEDVKKKSRFRSIFLLRNWLHTCMIVEK